MARWAGLEPAAAAHRIADGRKAEEPAAIAAYAAATGARATAVRALVDEVIAHRRTKAVRAVADDWRMKGWIVCVALASAGLFAFDGAYRGLSGLATWAAALPYLVLTSRRRRAVDAARG